MTKCTRAKISASALPARIPLFPLAGALLLPRGELPLNIFEPRYIAMSDAAIASPSRMIGMIQTREDGGLYGVGCAGRIASFHETEDGGYLITLAGICRFRIGEELPMQDGYRMAVPDFADFATDLDGCGGLDIDRDRLHALLKEYFQVEGLPCNWDKVCTAADDVLISVLSMVCPFSPLEKQALLETVCNKERARTFMAMLELAVRAGVRGDCSSLAQNCH